MSNNCLICKKSDNIKFIDNYKFHIESKKNYKKNMQYFLVPLIVIFVFILIMVLI